MSDTQQNLQYELDQALGEIQHYRRLVEDLGRNRLREVEYYSQLLKNHLETEKELNLIREELELRIQQRTAALTLANQQLQQEVLERGKLEQQLRINEQQFRLFMKHFPGLAYIKNANHQCIYANEGFSFYLGLNPDLIIGKISEDLFPADFARKIDTDDDKANQKYLKFSYRSK